LVGERGHLALQMGEESLPFLQTIWNCASQGGLLPEQVWDAAPIPALGLMPGRPSGSAMPLIWAHAEFLKLLIARESGRPVELLDDVEKRYRGPAPRPATVWHWRDEVPVWRLEKGRALCIEDRQPFTLHFGFDGWREIQDRDAVRESFGMWSVLLVADELAEHEQVDFTRRHDVAWEGIDHQVLLGHATVVHVLTQAD
jgi:glucoamylase